MKYDNIQKKRKEEKMGEKIMDCRVRPAPPLLGRVSDRTSRKASRRVEKKCIECLAGDVQRYLNLSLSKKKESAEGGDRRISSFLQNVQMLHFARNRPTSFSMTTTTSWSGSYLRDTFLDSRLPSTDELLCLALQLCGLYSNV